MGSHKQTFRFSSKAHKFKMAAPHNLVGPVNGCQPRSKGQPLRGEGGGEDSGIQTLLLRGKQRGDAQRAEGREGARAGRICSKERASRSGNRFKSSS